MDDPLRGLPRIPEEWLRMHREAQRYSDILDASGVREAMAGLGTFRLPAGIDSLVAARLTGVEARDVLTADLLRTAMVTPATADLLKNLGYIDRITPVTAALKDAFRPLIPNWADPVSARLKSLGVDPLTGTTLATAGATMEAFRGVADAMRTLEKQSQVVMSLVSGLDRQIAALSGITEAANALWAVPRMPSILQGFPSYLRVAPELEPYSAAVSLRLFVPSDVDLPGVLDLLAEEILDGVGEAFESRLASVDQGFLDPVRGAWETALSQTRDRTRQSASSVRYVIDELIKRLAPKARADAWIATTKLSKKSLVPIGAKDARSAGKWAPQLRYIMRNVDLAASTDGDSAFGQLTEADLVDMLLLLEQFNKAIHERADALDDESLALLLRRAMAFMTLLLDAYEFEA